MARTIKVISPIDQSVYVERELASDDEVERSVERAVRAQREWRQVPLGERVALLHRLVDALLAKRELVAEELTRQMGRPIAHSPGELRGFEERARYMLDIAPEALRPVVPEPKVGFKRYIVREPLGLVFVIAPWNYPYLTAVNAVVPALAAGNAVILKHSAQTPLVAERFVEAGREGGLPEGLFTYLHLDHEQVARLIAHPAVAHVAFTGSVEGGHAVQRAASGKFIACGLELGGKDPAYVRPDADLEYSVATLADGAFYNAGQSCCGIERIYVHESVYDAFVERFVAAAESLRLGDPLEPETTLGPVVRLSAARFIRRQVAEAVERGARALVDTSRFAAARDDSCYVAPQVLVDVDHTMSVMRDETFGPVVGIMKVRDDDEAVELMNDSPYGLTAAIFTSDLAAAENLGARIETGTVFMNRCDYLDPALAWTGVKETGRGATLSRIGYEHLTRPKSYHLKVAV